LANTFPNLGEFTFAGSVALKDDDAAALAAFPRLTTVHAADGVVLSKETCGGLAKIPTLRSIRGYYCQVFDGDIVPLLSSPTLKEFNMDVAPLTGACLDTFAKMPKLEVLRLTRCKIDDASFAKFQQARPDVKLVKE
jgi:hypothetical protein